MHPNGSSCVLAGHTKGSWSTTNAGEYDFMVINLDMDGHILWEWQVRLLTENSSYSLAQISQIRSVRMVPCCSFVVRVKRTGPLSIVVRFVSSLVRCKNVTVGDDRLSAGGVASDGSVVLAGFTTGAYAAENAGSGDFVVIKLDDRGKVVWTWQVRDSFARPSCCPACVHGSFFHQWLAVIIFVMKVNQRSMMIEAAFVLNTRIEIRNLYRGLLRRTCCHCSVCLPPWAPMFDDSRTVQILRTNGLG